MKYLYTILLLLSTLLAFTGAHPTSNVDSTIIQMNAISKTPITQSNISQSTNVHDGKWHLFPRSETARGPIVYFICETSNGSPRADYALLATNKLARKTDKHTCTVENANWCKKMWGYNHAALGLCGPWGFAMGCSKAAGYYTHLIKTCKLWKGGAWRVGGIVRIVNTEVWGDLNIYKV